MKCLKIFIVATVTIDENWTCNLERTNKMRRKKKMKRTRRRDIVNNIDDVMSFVWLKND